MKEIKITDISGVKVGQVEDIQAATGCSVVIVEKGATAGVDVRGGGPATRETDLLNPINMVQQIHAVMLSGGSAFGLDAASGAMQYLEEHDVGFDMSVARVPIVCGASLFDLSVGNPQVRPDKHMGYLACKDSENNEIKEGNYGAGCGASVGKLLGFDHAMKGGIGTYGLQVGAIQVAGLVAVNACGNVVDHESHEMLAGIYDKKTQQVISTKDVLLKQMDQIRKLPDGNTTIGCIVTNVKLNKAQCTKLAGICHDGYARSIEPVHTMSDGDTIFVLSTNEVEGMVDAVGVLASEVTSMCIKRAILKAESAYGLKAYSDLKNR
ncbi:P1 family peptidase [Faecalibacillus faecis]|uniref:P1 family peptidase n=1 Tax=Faecalibacillus faecis TaxID=1982628 RepID=UPI000664BEE8|nr:P1 family peptidase [Faecalibacillus faecis]KMV76931.1 L-aminopeptidase/D-esterase [Coprobacillus sp. 8_1_38FAA]RHH06643.1 peptidase S58 family protein [Coprobacillus sp. AM18-4LB-d2]